MNDDFIRIVHLEKLSVKYKIIRDLNTKEGAHFECSKKKFCALVKKAFLLSPEKASAVTPTSL